jgi:hypothetical protein
MSFHNNVRIKPSWRFATIQLGVAHRPMITINQVGRVENFGFGSQPSFFQKIIAAMIANYSYNQLNVANAIWSFQIFDETKRP